MLPACKCLSSYATSSAVTKTKIRLHFSFVLFFVQNLNYDVLKFLLRLDR